MSKMNSQPGCLNEILYVWGGADASDEASKNGGPRDSPMKFIMTALLTLLQNYLFPENLLLDFETLYYCR